jgi:hypothetical protein
MKKKALLIVLIAVAVIAIGGIAAFFAAESYTGRASFCGTKCHIMKPNYDTYKKDIHSKKDVACVDCHYAPGEKPTPKAKFRALGQLFSYLSTGDKEVRKRAVVNDLSCATSKCHPNDKFMDKKLDYTVKVAGITYHIDEKGAKKEVKDGGKLKPFIHKTHMEKTIEGQKLHCASCHVHNVADRHFDVPKESCFLCHFRKAKETDARAKCATCHEIPKKALESEASKGEKSADEEKKPITHESLEKAKVACVSCHYDLIKGANDLKKESCVECHHDATPQLLAKIKDKKAMHEAHVDKQTARCSQCHNTIEHKKEGSYLDAALQNCASCHSEPHLYQKIIIAGGTDKDAKKFPSLMHEVRTNCLGCHTEDGHDAKGNKVKKGSKKTCVDCHDKDYERMPKRWLDSINEEMETVRKLENNAKAAVEAAKGGKSHKKLTAMFRDGQDNLRIVTAGGGIHNKKYAMYLLGRASEKFEAVIKEAKAKK